jgi:AraC-like DNA-binding protein
MKFNFYNTIGVIVIFQTFFLTVFFAFNKKGIRSGNKILAILSAAYAVYLTFLLTAGNKSGVIFIKEQMPVLLLCVHIPLLFGPLLFYYSKSVVNGRFDFTKRESLHLLPFLFTIILAAIQVTCGHVYKISFFPDMFLYASLILVLQLFIYALLSLKTFRLKIDSWVAPIEDIKLTWLLFLIFGTIVIAVIQSIIFVFTFMWWDKNLYQLAYRIYLIATFVFFISIAFIALIKPEIFSFSKKYQNFEFKESDKEDYKSRLLKSMEKEKIYLDPTLTLASLAKKLSVPAPYLSRIVNESFETNFCDFVNRYRIEESKQLLKELSTSKKTILEIAYLVGFNSKSTFYDAFKNQTGLTPSEFQKNNYSYN